MTMINDITENMINTEGTVFGILVKAHGLTHVTENIYEAPGGMKYHLTKFGLEPAVQYNLFVQLEVKTAELKEVSGNLIKKKAELTKAQNKIATKDEGKDTLIDNLNKKIKMYKDSQDTTPAGNKKKNEKINELKSTVKMKNIEIDGLKRQLAVGKPAKIPKQQHATMPKKMISQITNNINAILNTPMSAEMKIQQIQTILA